MAGKVVSCIICGDEVSKRKSLAFGEGRACRSHQEVIDMVEAKEEEFRSEQLNKQITVSMMALHIIAMHDVTGIPYSILLSRISKEARAQVEARIENYKEVKG